MNLPSTRMSIFRS